MSLSIAAEPGEVGSHESSTNTAWVGEARRAVSGLFQPKPWIYWTDFLLTVAVAYTAASLFLTLPGITPWRALSYVVAVLALFRAGSFTHELVHLRTGGVKFFHVAYDAIFGIPTMFPSFAYYHHLDHHRVNRYATVRDGEYLPLGREPRAQLLSFFLAVFYTPVIVLLRFLIVTPLSFMNPRWRQWTLERGSSFGIVNFAYRRDLADCGSHRAWDVVDFLCFLRATVLIVLVVIGVRHWTFLGLLYLLAIGSLAINFLRAIALHEFQGAGEEMSYGEQVEDSITIEGNPLLNELIFPLGLRYHALHHMFPALPYHNLGIAHRRLMAVLPEDSPYRKTVFPSYWAVLGNLWRNVRNAKPESKRG